MNIRALFDGCCEPTNPGGNMGMGAIAILGDYPIFQHSDFAPAAKENSNNVAEYKAFHALIDFLLGWLGTFDGASRIDIRGDSKMVVCQVNGDWKIKQGRYVEYAKDARVKWEKLRLECAQRDILLSLKWIPRAQNGEADALSKKHLIDNGVEFKIQPNDSSRV